MKKLVFIICLLLLTGCTNEETKDSQPPVEDLETKTVEVKPEGLSYTKAVWWWDNTLTDEYLHFARDNKVTDIYYCDSKFNIETEDFIKKANSFGMNVYCLQGEYQWIEDRTGLDNKITKFLEFQENAEHKFKGIHLDVEPHQHPEFHDNRIDLVTKFVEMVIYLNNTYSISFDYDVPFWLDDIVTIKGVSKEAYKWIIDYANCMVIMSYRDTVEAILDVVKEEVEYSVSVGKNIMISVETYSTEGDFVSFNEEGKKVLNEVINNIFLEKPTGISGIAIHHIKQWYNLKD